MNRIEKQNMLEYKNKYALDNYRFFFPNVYGFRHIAVFCSDKYIQKFIEKHEIKKLNQLLEITKNKEIYFTDEVGTITKYNSWQDFLNDVLVKKLSVI